MQDFFWSATAHAQYRLNTPFTQLNAAYLQNSCHVHNRLGVQQIIKNRRQARQPFDFFRHAEHEGGECAVVTIASRQKALDSRFLRHSLQSVAAHFFTVAEQTEFFAKNVFANQDFGPTTMGILLLSISLQAMKGGSRGRAAFLLPKCQR